ncbi:hypothetical protein CIHG_00221 [Coccidioides immitis H538.4]|uniref:Uncharacterized protein n=3 Tax=Coccidioides immitis TaxID=5501 RepID=A0A0J8QLW8_COCIT|nr:hypothetical protein CIRG_07040 [Coccidioides immitis RMSCC 2394]KMU72188.1 hypothetical protein CISG_00497 [Coccidioides immitis RMSCC 3703]KMU82439.1 hypothetical protein CIHG_00221 [Coccidioides immitis H538.4]
MQQGTGDLLDSHCAVVRRNAQLLREGQARTRVSVGWNRNIEHGSSQRGSPNPKPARLCWDKWTSPVPENKGYSYELSACELQSLRKIGRSLLLSALSSPCRVAARLSKRISAAQSFGPRQTPASSSPNPTVQNVLCSGYIATGGDIGFQLD